MKLIQIPDVLHEYLLHLIQAHAARGIHPEEGMAINHLWEAVAKHATHIDDAEIQKAATITAAPDPEELPAVQPPPAPGYWESDVGNLDAASLGSK